jgi:hypothetical protein
LGKPNKIIVISKTAVTESETIRKRRKDSDHETTSNHIGIHIDRCTRIYYLGGGGGGGRLREVGEIEGVNAAHAKLLVVAGTVVERREGEVIEDEVAVERVGVEPELVPEAYPRHVRARRRWRRRWAPSNPGGPGPACGVAMYV